MLEREGTLSLNDVVETIVGRVLEFLSRVRHDRSILVEELGSEGHIQISKHTGSAATVL